MSADQVAEISPGVREAIAGSANLCATFEVAGDHSRWVQFTRGVINATYPHPEDPAARIATLGSAVVEAYLAGQHITVRLSLTEPRAIAQWIDRYFEQVLAAAADYSVDLSLKTI